jgi:hypothetical protein
MSAVVVALADDRHQAETFLNALAQREQDPVRGLLLLIELHGAGLMDPSRVAMRRVGVQGWGEALRNPRIHASIAESVTFVREAIVRLIERGQRTGQVRSGVNADAVARTLIAVFQGFVLQSAWGEEMDPAACGQVIRDFIGGSLLTQAGQATFETMTAATAEHLPGHARTI